MMKVLKSIALFGLFLVYHADGSTSAVIHVSAVMPQIRQASVTKGMEDANRDFSSGVARIEVYGLRGASGSATEQYLAVTYGVQIDAVTGCLVTEQILGHAEGYNKRMKELLFSKYKKDIFAEAEVMTVLAPVLSPMDISVISNRVVLTTRQLSGDQYKDVMRMIQAVLGTNTQVTLIMK